MLDIKFIRENQDLIKENSKNRLSSADIDKLLELDQKRRSLEEKIETLRSKRNLGSKTKPTETEIAEMKSIGDEIGSLEKELEPVEQKYSELLLEVPNLTHKDVKVSLNEDDNVVLEQKMEPTKFDFTPLDHVELAEKLDLIDFERGTKVAGAKFYYFKNQLVSLDMALTKYAFDIATKHGYIPMITPDIAKKDIVNRMGYNPRGDSTQVYNIEKSDLSLIGTAEITVGGYHKDEVIPSQVLPKKYVAFSHCFRTEAGAYSKFSKGIFRVHQFSKVELFTLTLPAKAEELHQEMIEIEKEIYTNLGIPFRVVDHCTADLGAPSYRTIDLEAWLPGKASKEGGMGDWAEITSASNCTDYQSRALNIKYLDAGKKDYVYTLNGSAIPMTRPIIAILENFQERDGSIKMPDVLIPYLGFEKITNK